MCLLVNDRPRMRAFSEQPLIRKQTCIDFSSSVGSPETPLDLHCVYSLCYAVAQSAFRDLSNTIHFQTCMEIVNFQICHRVIAFRYF